MRVSEQLFLDVYSAVSQIALVGVSVDTPISDRDFQDSITCEIAASADCSENNIRIQEFFRQVDELNGEVDSCLADVHAAAENFKLAVERLYKKVDSVEVPKLDLISDDDCDIMQFEFEDEPCYCDPTPEEEEFNEAIARDMDDFEF